MSQQIDEIHINDENEANISSDEDNEFRAN